MDFFQKKWVKALAFIMIATGTVVLLIGGFSVDGVTSFISAVAGVVSALGFVIALIIDGLKNKDNGK